MQIKLVFFEREEIDNRINSRVQPLTALLSDTLVHSFPLVDLNPHKSTPNIGEEFTWILRRITNIQSIFLRHGMLIRGSVTIGNLLNHNGMAYGEGLAKAKALEEKGKVPFVHFDRDVLKHMENSIGENELDSYLLGLSQNELAYFDWLGRMWISNLHDEMRPELFERVNEQVGQINKNLVATKECEGAYKKWLKTAEYFDEAIRRHNENHLSIDSYQPESHWLYRGEPIRFP